MYPPRGRGGWTQKCGISEDVKVEGFLWGRRHEKADHATRRGKARERSDQRTDSHGEVRKDRITPIPGQTLKGRWGSARALRSRDRHPRPAPPRQPLRVPASPGSEFTIPVHPTRASRDNQRPRRPPWRCPGHRGPAACRHNHLTDSRRSTSNFSPVQTHVGLGKAAGNGPEGEGPVRSLKRPRKSRLVFFRPPWIYSCYTGLEMAVVPEDARISVFSCFCLEGRAEHQPGGSSPGASALSGENITGPGCSLEILMMPCAVSQSCRRSTFVFPIVEER